MDIQTMNLVTTKCVKDKKCLPNYVNMLTLDT